MQHFDIGIVLIGVNFDLEVCKQTRRQAKKTIGSSSTVGDNCPFIYAIKGKIDGLHVNMQTIRDLVNPLNTILDKFIQSQRQKGIIYDLIVPMPSSHRIADILAQRISRKTKAPMDKSLFRKSTVEDVIDIVDINRDIPHSARMNIFNAINQAKDEDKAFSLGDVKTDFRDYVRPLSLVGTLPACERVLLVDDLFASGKTLVTARDELLDVNPTLTIDSFCLFSPLNNRIRPKKR